MMAIKTSNTPLHAKNNSYYSICYLCNEQGRSLTEMLGTLAIMAIISMVGIKTFNAAMIQHRANELINEANKRAVTVAAQIMAGREKNALSVAEFPNPDRYTFGVEGNATNNHRFNITVDAVDVDVCKKMKSMVGPSTVLRALSSDCTTLTFNDDLSREAVASDYSNDQSACQETGNTWCQYGDNNAGSKCFSGSISCCSVVSYNDSQCQRCTSIGSVVNKANTTDCYFNNDTNKPSKCNSGVCVDPSVTANKACTSNADCGGTGSGYYCKMTANLNGSLDTANTSCFKNLTGNCMAATHPTRLTTEQQTLLTQAGFASTTVKGPYLNWWSANNWCQAHGKHLLDVSKIGCYRNGSTIVEGAQGYAYCCKQGQSCQSWTTLWDDKSILPGKAKEVAMFSDKMVALRKVFGGTIWFWTASPYGNGNSSQDSCYAFIIRPSSGIVDNYYARGGNVYALCE